MKIKIKYLVPALAVVAALAVSPFLSVAENSPEPPAASPAGTPDNATAAAAPKITPEQRTLFLQGLGWLVGQQSGLVQELGIAAEDVPAVAEGFRLALLGEGKEIPEKIIATNEAYSAFIQELQTAAATKAAELNKKISDENKALGKEFIAKKLAEDAAFVALPSGVLMKKHIAGDESKKPTSEDVVAVRYTGKLIDGSIFDSAERDPQTGAPVDFTDKCEPVEMPLSGLIAAWTEALPQLGVGGKCTLIVPSEFAYGDHAIGTIPPGSTLVFDIELVSISAAPEQPEAEGVPVNIPELEEVHPAAPTADAPSAE